ncbi:MAG TPA: hypothetical protein PLO14_06360 [Accumulibacter sp.]|uniref:hypothetical protein n=1 Tax=Accumulibacter sp. TaxID=2053492 RepID=UPI0025DB16E7|nr:hypothetical protein [Accumulibacter sp.]MCM8598139.1 hypothetical protein [Accumulibacter sp.]MCM8662094.1 hypothetical protein [Accumulibacter sp.]HNC51849.1 hypothetical protein [Accumulibacter sp.]
MGDAESRLLDLIEMTYHAADDATMVQAVFVGLHDRMPFPTASFSPVATNTLVLQDGLCFEFVSTCGSDYRTSGLPPYLGALHCVTPEQFNHCLPVAEVIGPGLPGRSASQQFARRLPDYHAVGLLAAARGQPFALLTVERQRDDVEFSRGERLIIDRIGPHLGRAIALRRRLDDSAQPEKTRRVFWCSRPTDAHCMWPPVARGFLASSPEEAVLAALPAQGSGVVRLASHSYRVSRLRCPPAW